MLNACLCPAADSDVEAAWRLIATSSIERADFWLVKLDARLRMLVESPLAGRLRDELGEGIRSTTFGHHQLYYRVDSRGIEVIRILHTSHDLPEQIDRSHEHLQFKA